MKYLFVLIPLLLSSCGTGPTTKKLPKNLDSLIVMFPDSTELLIKRGAKFLEEYKHEEALNDAAKAFRLDSSAIENRLLYANVLNNKPQRSVNDVLTAQRHFKFIVEKEKENTKAIVGLASTYSFLQDFETSFIYINNALRIDPKLRDAYILKGSNYLTLGKRDLAKSSYETAVQQDPKFWEGYVWLGALYQAEENPLCIEYYTSAAQLQPKNLDVLYSLAFAKQVFNEEKDAIRIYRKMIQLDNEFHEALFQIGRIYHEQNNIDSATYYYNSSIITNPEYVEAYHNLGLIYEAKGDIENALKNYAKALKYNPTFELSRKQADGLRNKR
ncbi:MAG: tetratricopeptide repeat protein [Bacteroidota bacterium]